MLISFFISLLGFMFAFRICNEALGQHVITQDQMTKIGTVYVLATLLQVFVSFQSYFAFWFFTFAPHVSLVIVIKVIRLTRAKKFREKFYEALNVMLLKMKSGKAFRHALSEVIDETDAHTRRVLNEVRDIVVFSQQHSSPFNDRFIENILLEFICADQSPHSSIRRLSTFRDRIRLENDFRRRSGQVLQQTRAQSIIVSFLYLAVLFFVVREFGWRANALVISISACLFGIGLMWIQIGGRRLRWKI